MGSITFRRLFFQLASAIFVFSRDELNSRNKSTTTIRFYVYPISYVSFNFLFLFLSICAIMGGCANGH